ncbi:MAG: NAD(P)-dependent oxidoreductase [Bacteroidales bacterium]|nr:NAD(P)-dependent oxidoreductase [Bacteroidales bacterium]MBN2762172.1 NAD(P)-dependent oxidoreductase [Bacteroidales bacterium]
MQSFKFSANPVIGWIGTGVMGSSMFSHLLQKGYKGIVYTRTKAKAAGVLEKGAVWADSIALLAAKSNVIFTMVGYPEDVREIYLNKNGILNNAKPGTVLVDMTTTSPSLAIEIHDKALQINMFSLDAPVSGGDVGARNAALSIMAGGDKEVFDIMYPFFKVMGKKIVHQGKAGSGQHTKMCNQIVIAGTMIGMCESLLYGYKAGLDLHTMLGSISGGAAACWSLDNLAPRILKRDFEPGFFVDHFVKDMGIALEEAKRMHLSLPGLSLAHQLYESVQKMGYGLKGTQALMMALENLAG